MQCKQILDWTCSEGHKTTYQCFKKQPEICRKCKAEAIKKAEKVQRDHELDLKREARQKAYAQELAEIQDEINRRRQSIRDQQVQEEQQRILQQYRLDLANLNTPAQSASTVQAGQSASTVQADSPNVVPANNVSGSNSPKLNTPQTDPSTPSSSPPPPVTLPTTPSKSNTLDKWKPQPSAAKTDWEHQKSFENANNDALDELMGMVGLENVKEKFLDIKATIDTAIRQGIDLKDERFGVSLLGNPGTGKCFQCLIAVRFAGPNDKQAKPQSRACMPDSSLR